MTEKTKENCFHENLKTAKVGKEEMAVCKDCGKYINPADFDKEKSVTEPKKVVEAEPKKEPKKAKVEPIPAPTVSKDGVLFEVTIDGLVSVPGFEDGFYPLTGVKKGDVVKVYRK